VQVLQGFANESNQMLVFHVAYVNILNTRSVTRPCPHVGM